MNEQPDGRGPIEISRRSAVSGMALGAAATALFARTFPASAQEATPAAGQCVAMAPPADESGIAFESLLVGGMVPDMPPGPVEVRISRLAMAPGTVIEAYAVPYPALMYIEAGITACPGAPGRIVYGPDGAVVAEATEEGVQYTPAGSTQYIPAGIPDGAGNEETELMSSIIIEFVPVVKEGTPTA